MLSRRLTAVKSYKRRYFIMKAPSMSIVWRIHRTRAPVKIADDILRLLCAVILIAGFVLAPPWPRGSAEPRDFRTTPNPFRLIANQWSDFPALSRPYSLEFLRSTDRATARISLKEAILIGLKNNPGIEVERLEPLRAAEQTMSEKSIFDLTLTFESKLLDAQGAELHAITDYNNSIAALRLVEGTLLEHYNIKVERPEKEPNPWWATF